MLYLPESVAAASLSLDDAILAVEQAFAAFAKGAARTFPVASAEGFDERQRWAIKSGYDRDGGTIGCKIGSNWPGNNDRQLPTHGSTTILIDPETGFAQALIGAAHLTVLRTAAADAVGVKYLARADAATLAIVGAGHQALWDARAIARVRALADIRVTSRDAAKAERFAETLRGDGLPARATALEEAVRGADLVSTATAAKAPVLDDAWVSPGTHFSAMGADSRGKQELPLALVRRARLFCDVPGQSATIGEFQTIAAESGDSFTLTSIGDVINGAAPGRTDDREITIFDSSGMAVQDLAISRIALERARRAGVLTDLPQ